MNPLSKGFDEKKIYDLKRLVKFEPANQRELRFLLNELEREGILTKDTDSSGESTNISLTQYGQGFLDGLKASSEESK